MEGKKLVALKQKKEKNKGQKKCSALASWSSFSMAYAFGVGKARQKVVRKMGVQMSYGGEREGGIMCFENCLNTNGSGFRD